MILEGWSANVNFGGASTDWADHTWVRSPANNQFFDCWGDHQGPNTRRIVSGDGSYNWANCYRCHIWPFRDTAGIGIYAVDGVCHQSANCFLYSANRTLNLDVRGYWFSLFSFGTFGRSYLRWLAAPYGWCTWTTTRALTAAQPPEEQEEGDVRDDRAEEDPAIRIAREVYGQVAASRKPKHPHELLTEEVGKITELYVPEVDFAELRDIQLDYLQKKDELYARGLKEERLAKRLDDLARRTQKQIAKRIGRERYERLMGMPAGEEVGIVEPGAAGMAGVPVPPPESMAGQSGEQEAHEAEEDVEENPGDR